MDPAATYELSAHLRAAAGSLDGILLGLFLADARGREIKHWNVHALPGTRTELAAPCRPDDRVLRVRAASAWKPGSSFVAAFGAGENELTFDVTPPGIAAIRPDGAGWAVTLAQPCGIERPAGTPVAENMAGGNGLFFAVPAATGDWTEVAATVGPRQWWPGTASARVVVLGSALRRGSDARVLLLDDLAFRKRAPAKP